MAGQVRSRRRGLVALSVLTVPGPIWSKALLCGTQLQGADLRGVHLAGARASADTGWPPGFDWRAAGARLVQAC